LAKLKPNSGYVPSSHSIPHNVDPIKRTWVFSFKFFCQQENYGLKSSSIANNWIISFLDKAKEFSGYEVDAFLNNLNMRDYWRFHPIDFNDSRVFLKKSDLYAIPNNYLDYPDTYPIYQFQITKGTGRVIGFLDENQAFQVVLFDPLHNVYPSEKNNGNIRPCSALDNQYESLLHFVKKYSLLCNDAECRQRLSNIENLQPFSQHLFYQFVIDKNSPTVEQIEYLNNLYDYDMLKIFEEAIDILTNQKLNN
jgi:hypothetical protein